MAPSIDDALFGDDPDFAAGLVPDADDDPTQPEIASLGAVLFADVPPQTTAAPPEFRPELAGLPTRSRARAARWTMAGLAFVATIGAAAGTYVAIGRDEHGRSTPANEVNVRGAAITRGTTTPSTSTSSSTTSTTSTTTTSTTAAPATTLPANTGGSVRQPAPEPEPDPAPPVPEAPPIVEPPAVEPPADPPTTTTTAPPPTTTEPPAVPIGD